MLRDRMKNCQNIQKPFLAAQIESQSEAYAESRLDTNTNDID